MDMAVFAKPLPSDDGVRQAKSSRRVAGGAATPIGLLLSGAAHAALLLVLILRPMNDRGLAPDLSDAMSIEFVASDTIEANDSPAETISPSEMPDSTPPQSVEEVQDGKPEIDDVKVQDNEPIVDAAPKPSEDQTPVADAPEIPVIRGASEPDEAAPERRRKVEKQPAPQAARRDTERQREEARPKAEAPRRIEKSAASKSPGTVASVASKSKAAASRGDIAGYAARVRARVAGRRPAGNGVKGTVIVSFSVGGGGGLGSARIVRSSGSGALDAAALQAVRGAAPFPPPPGGRSLSFSVPFHYQ